MTHVAIEAPAKINLRLVVLSREASGYHTLETLFCGISLADFLEVETSGSEVSLEVTGGIEVGPAANNLVLRAAQAFHERLGRSTPVRIRLDKQVPAAAGLGGGSSDAAATLRALNALHGQPFDDTELRSIGASLGSDVPFFLGGSPFAFAWSRGERLLELEPPAERHLLLVLPGIAIPTPTAYGRLDQLRTPGASSSAGFAIPLASLTDWETIASLAENDFEPVAREMIPRFDRFKDMLAHAGGKPVLLSGSGSSIFGIFESADALAAAEGAARNLALETRRARTLREWPRPTVRH